MLQNNNLESISTNFFEVNVRNKTRIQVHSFNAFSSRNDITHENVILFLIKGKMKIKSDSYPVFEIHTSQMFFIPLNTSYHAFFEEDCEILLIYFDPFQRIKEIYSIEELFTFSKSLTFTAAASVLDMNEVLQVYVKNLRYYISCGLLNEEFSNIKIAELLVLLGSYFQKEVLCEFFKQILTNDPIFTMFVLKNCLNVKSVKEMAKLSIYCETSFNKKFKRVFGITPYKWLNDRRSSRIHFELVNSDKPLKKIAEEYEFNTLQQFTSYCIRNFKLPPGKLRKK